MYTNKTKNYLNNVLPKQLNKLNLILNGEYVPQKRIPVKCQKCNYKFTISQSSLRYSVSKTLCSQCKYTIDNKIKNKNRVLGGYKKPKKKSKYRGVCWDSGHSKWRAAIKYEGKKYYLGLFFDEIEAAKKYDEEAKSLHGINAKINFP